MREINKKPFSVGLYIEGLRQLRIVGILGVILMFGSSLVTNISRALNYRRQATLYPEESLVLYPIDGVDAMSLLVIVFCAFAPIMVWMLFHFMNKRNSSDFMFAIPNTRLSIYCSYLSAIITWIAAMVLAGLIGVLLPAAIFSNYLNIMYDTVFLFALSTFLCSLQVISVVLIAMSITGTFFSNIVLSGMLLFGPRLFIYMLTSIPESIPFICEAPNRFSFWSTSINPIFGFVFEIILERIINGTTIFYSAVPMIYSVVLSVIYLLFAAFLFQRRKSETAGKSAPNPLLQAIYRIAITMLYCIAVAVIILFECNEMTDGMIFSIIVAYLIAVALYFLFELVMTKSLRKMWKAAPGLLIVLVLNGVTIFGMRAAIHNAYQFQPTAEQVESISFVSQKIENGTYIYYNDYIQQKCTDVITDQELISNILENLKEDKDLFENGGHGNYYSNEPRNRYKGFYFKIKTKSETRYRYIRIDPKTQRVLAEQLQQSFQNGNESWRIPPEPIEGSIWTYNDGGYNWEEGSEKRTALFEQLKEELQTVDFLDWYDINHNGTETATFYFNYEVHTEDKETYQFNIPVYAALYPKTAELYNTYLYESEKEEIAEAKQFVETKMQNLRSSEDYDVDITAYYYDTQSQSYQTADISSTTFLKEIFENGLLDQPIGNTDSYVDINIYVYYDEYTYDEDAYYGGNLRVAVKSDILKSFISDEYQDVN